MIRDDGPAPAGPDIPKAIAETHKRTCDCFEPYLVLNLSVRYWPTKPQQWPVDWAMSAPSREWFKDVPLEVLELFRDSADRSHYCGHKTQLCKSWHEEMMLYAEGVENALRRILADDHDVNDWAAVSDPQCHKEVAESVLRFWEIDGPALLRLRDREFRTAKVRAEDREAATPGVAAGQKPEPNDRTDRRTQSVLGRSVSDQAKHVIAGGEPETDEPILTERHVACLKCLRKLRAKSENSRKTREQIGACVDPPYGNATTVSKETPLLAKCGYVDALKHRPLKGKPGGLFITESGLTRLQHEEAKVGRKGSKKVKG